MTDAQKAELIRQVEVGLAVARHSGHSTMKITIKVSDFTTDAILRPGRGHYVEYICTCGYQGGVSSRQAKHGITCPLCDADVCEGPVKITRCPECGKKACSSKAIVFCDCMDWLDDDD